MDSTVELVVIIIILLFIIYWFSPRKEKFNTTFYESSLEDDMDYIKDNKGRTLNDYILEDHITTGKGIDSPF